MRFVRFGLYFCYCVRSLSWKVKCHSLQVHWETSASRNIMSEPPHRHSRNTLYSLTHHRSTNRHTLVHRWSLIGWYEAVCSVEILTLRRLRVRVGVKWYRCLNQDDLINTINANVVWVYLGQDKGALIVQNSNRRLTGSKIPRVNQRWMFQTSIHTPSPTYA